MCLGEVHAPQDMNKFHCPHNISTDTRIGHLQDTQSCELCSDECCTSRSKSIVESIVGVENCLFYPFRSVQQHFAPDCHSQGLFFWFSSCQWSLLVVVVESGRCGETVRSLFLLALLQRYNTRYPKCNSSREQNAILEFYHHVIRTASARCEANYFLVVAPCGEAYPKSFPEGKDLNTPSSFTPFPSGEGWGEAFVRGAFVTVTRRFCDDKTEGWNMQCSGISDGVGVVVYYCVQYVII